MVDFIQGPLAVITFLVFGGGLTFQVVRCYRLSRSIQRPSATLIDADGTSRSQPQPVSLAFKLRALKHTIIGAHPIMMGVTLLFHVCALLVPLFVMAHNIMLDSAWGLSLPSLPDAVADTGTLLVILAGLFFLGRRLLSKRVRAISGPQDYLLLLIATAPFVTGYLAYHQIGDYRTMAILHILSGEILLITAPFSKLVHMVFFFFGRFLVVHENNLGRVASRVWR
jgi:nitrate reductase gamma subunit